jgi:hypothetical protein
MATGGGDHPTWVTVQYARETSQLPVPICAVACATLVL